MITEGLQLFEIDRAPGSSDNASSSHLPETHLASFAKTWNR
jgi:hypothetical protein